MNKNAILIIGLLASLVLMSACSSEPTADNANAANTNAANQAADNADPLAVQTPKKEETTNNAPILSPVLKEYCRAKVAKDEAALRKIYWSESIKRFEEGMKQDGIKSLPEYLAIDEVTNEPCEARNEVINGDNGSAEIRVKFAPQGVRIKFVKENGEWKITDMPDTEASNAAEQKAKQ